MGRRLAWGLAIACVVVCAGGRSASAAPGCTAPEKARAEAAVAAYARAMPAQRKAFARRHPRRADRARFAKRQQATLDALKRRASCEVTPPPPPPPPPDQTPPALTLAGVNAATLTLTYSEPVRSPPATTAITVRENGMARTVTGSAAEGAVVTLTLDQPVWADDAVTVAVGPGAVVDAAGNPSAASGTTPAGNSSPTGFDFDLSVPSWANDRGPSSPNVGLWRKGANALGFLPATHVRAVMLFVDWPDYPATGTTQELSNAYIPVAESWFREASYGRFDYAVTPVQHWYRMSRPSTAYNLRDCCARTNTRDAIAEAARLADADVDFSKYDVIYVITAVAPEVSVLLQRTWPGEGFTIDGKSFDHGVISSGYTLHGGFVIDPNGNRFDDTRWAHNIVTHETGHLLGLADLYYKASPTADNSFDLVGGWSIMENTVPAAHYLAWEKWILGWLDANQLRGLPSPGTIEETLTPIETPGGMKAFVVPIDAGHAYVAEVRQPVGKDAGICDHGVLLYTVDSTRRNADGVARVLPSHAESDPAKVHACGSQYAAPFDVGPGETATYDDAAIHLDVLSTDGTNYRVRVTRK